MFQNILRSKGEVERFKFNHIIDKMTKLEQKERYASFNDISQAISEGVISEIDFSRIEKDMYKKFADALVGHILYYNDKYDPINDIDIILNKLGTLIRSSSLETFIQDNSQLIKCFIKGSYRYNDKCDIEVQHVKNFYQLMVKLDPYKQKIVLDNIQTRLGGITINITDDDLPF